MIYRDPSHQLLKAYQELLSGHLVYAGEEITVGTRIPKRKTKYVYLYIESMENFSTGDKAIYNITVAMQIVSLQEVNEGDETVVMNILEQILPIVDADAIIMDDFNCLTSFFGDMETENEMNETNYSITKKLRMLHFIEQK